jgi:penicillin amidase
MFRFELRLLLLVLVLSACVDDDEPAPAPSPLDAVAVTLDWTLPCLSAPVHVLRTEHDVPHIYGENEADVACAQGFVTARDRYFQMDVISRFGTGRLSELLGEDGLANDIEARNREAARIAQQIVDDSPPDVRAILDGFAEGVNAFIEAVRSDRMEAPAEVRMVHALLGFETPGDMLAEWDALSVAGVAATVNFVSGFETTDIKWQGRMDSYATYALGLPKSELRRAGALHDIANLVAPAHLIESSAGFLDGSARSTSSRRELRLGPTVEAATMQRALDLVDRLEESRLWRRNDEPWGSNTWAVGPSITADGHAIVAGDGHLALTSPAFLYRTHLDTQLLGEGDLHVTGLSIAGVPAIGLGTNGLVAWSHTSQTSDINDYYRDEVVLGGDGRPAATRFRGEEIPVEEIVETYHVAPVLGAVERDVTISRWRTGSGRPFFSIEGNRVDGPDDDPAAINVFGDWIVASDTDGDGAITAITGAAPHFEERYMLEHVRGWAKARNVDEWAAAHHGMTSYSQHFVVGDADGNLLYSGFQAMPCRGYLPRDEDGFPLPGANPQLLIDGTQYPSFKVAYDAAHKVAAHKDDELLCTLTPDEYPHRKNPEQGWLVNSNIAPWSGAFDNNLWNDPAYLGGPWAGTYRASRIAQLIEEGAGTHTIETMAAIQGDHVSRLATDFLQPVLLDALQTVVDLAATDGPPPDPASPEARMLTLYLADQEAMDEAHARLRAWDERGRMASTGVETIWNSPTPDDVQDSVATMIWNAFFSRWVGAVFDDEGLPGFFRPYGMYARLRTLTVLLSGEAPGGLPASHDPETGESVFFDDLRTPDITESSEELAINQLAVTLEYLAEPYGPGRVGGFNTEDQDQWKWGLKHFVRFENFVGSEIGDDTLGTLFRDMDITPDVVPFASPEPDFGDPRRALPGFPRACDASCIDAAGGLSRTDFSYGSGPVMRMVIDLDPAGMRGVNIIPGGQVANPESPFFADQTPLWLANEASPMRFYVDDVVANAVGHELLHP